MKKVLFISPNEIFGYGGGAISQKRIYHSLKEIEDEKLINLKVISLDKEKDDSFIQLKKNRKMDILARIKLHSIYMYIEFKKIKRVMKTYKPDIIILGSSRLGFLAKYISKKNNIYIITNFENIEFDYVDAYFLLKKSILKNIQKKIEKILVYRDEKKSVIYSNKLIFLTKRDKERCNFLYQNVSNFEILPICIKQNDELINISNKKNIVFLGSLNYESNIDAILWFIDNVWNKYYKNSNKINLIIGGSNCPNSLENKINKFNNIKLYNNFSCIKDIVPINSIFIAPIRIGAGMKVKVAEALSLGSGILGSSEAFIGYEEIFQLNEDNIFVKKIESELEYKKYIDEYLNMSDDEIAFNKKRLKEIFYQFYSYNRAKKILKNILFE